MRNLPALGDNKPQTCETFLPSAGTNRKLEKPSCHQREQTADLRNLPALVQQGFSNLQDHTDKGKHEFSNTA
ncbi:hypothetical protein DWB61_06835 [Ancylomarina euxinus]|uniref:Uncharacterized protein n=1 Tax=Ancylomarina euxinus TaxID=2283627 RepID=A0A425Y329_9BACT|nr:hypothetical protein DWB61_06835 [Ancylomarina euxinus]